MDGIKIIIKLIALGGSIGGVIISDPVDSTLIWNGIAVFLWLYILLTDLEKINEPQRNQK